MKTKWRGWMTRAQARAWMCGKLGALLIRESTDPQMLMFGPTMQLRAAEGARADTELSPWTRTYALAHTGTDIFASPIVQQLIADATAGVFQVLVIAYGSRFARDLADGMTLLRVLNDLGVAIYFVHEDVLVGYERGWMKRIGHQLVEAHTFSDERSQQSEDNIRERFRSGYAHCKPSFGFTTTGSPRRRFALDETQVAGKTRWEWRRWMAEALVRENKTTREIAEVLRANGVRTSHGRPFSKSTVRLVLLNPMAIGQVWYRPNSSDAEFRQEDNLRIVSDGLFEDTKRVLATRAARHKSPAREVHVHVFENIAVCAACKRSLWYSVRSETIGLYHSNASIDETCSLQRMPCREFVLSNAVGALFDAIELPDEAIDLVQRYVAQKPVNHEVAKLRAKLSAKLETAKEMRLEGEYTAVRYREVRDLIVAELAALPADPETPQPEQVTVMTNLGEVWKLATRAERRQLAALLIERITVDCDPQQLAELTAGTRQRIRGGAYVADIVIRPRFRDLFTLGLAYVNQDESRLLNLSYPSYRDEVASMRQWLDRRRAA